MGTWTLWIAFNAGIALLLLFDLGVVHRRAHTVSLREAGIASALWVALSVAFGLWILASHRRGPGLEFFTGYVIEQSMSLDNVFLFVVIFQYFRVDGRYHHRLLFWGVLGAIVMRGVMIGLGIVLIRRFDWILYVFGAFLLYAGSQLLRADHEVHPEKNPFLHWAQKILPVSQTEDGPGLFVREAGRWLATPLFLVVVVLETTDLVFAVDSIPATFGITRDPFLVYTSNVCAILGLRAFYFLLAGILPYLTFLDEGLAIVLMFVGAKMLAEPWLHISTGISLAIIGSIITVSVVVSLIAMKSRKRTAPTNVNLMQLLIVPDNLPVGHHIGLLSRGGQEERVLSARLLFLLGLQRASHFLSQIHADSEFHRLWVLDGTLSNTSPSDGAKITVGLAVLPETFEAIRAANGSPPLADVPPDQDALEFEMHFKGPFALDILTTRAPGDGGAIARFLEKFGEGIQQVEIDVTDVDRATEILRTRFKTDPIYPATRLGANGTRVNFFLVVAQDGKKVLVELVEQPKAVA
jgi:tellurite resistance protein TerC